MGIRNFAHNHPIIAGAIAGSIVPGIGTVTGALIGLGYAVVTEDDKKRGWTPRGSWPKGARLAAIGTAIVVWLAVWATVVAQS